MAAMSAAPMATTLTPPSSSHGAGYPWEVSSPGQSVVSPAPPSTTTRIYRQFSFVSRAEPKLTPLPTPSSRTLLETRNKHKTMAVPLDRPLSLRKMAIPLRSAIT